MIQKHTLAAMSFICIVTTILAAAVANAQTPAAVPAAPAAPGSVPAGYKYDRAGTIGRVEVYLSGITTLKADFNQVAPDGSVQTGVFSMKRPGKMRWQYNPPTPVLLVSDGKTITYFDSELGQVNYISVDDTLASFLARSDMRLESEATTIKDFKAEADMIRITLVQKAKPTEGELTLEFVDHPLQLKFMTVTDATGATTKVQLQGAQYGVPLADSLFVFKDPRGVTVRKPR